jgi:hypothetical protein
MKNVVSNVRTLLFAFALSLPLISRADNHLLDTQKPKSFNLGLYQIQNSSKVSLAIVKAAASRMTLLIKDAQGNILHREVIGKGKESYKRNFNLQEMGDGTYYFEMISDVETVTKKVNLSTATTQLIALE